MYIWKRLFLITFQDNQSLKNNQVHKEAVTSLIGDVQ
jgi:hypothetical protein